MTRPGRQIASLALALLALTLGAFYLRSTGTRSFLSQVDERVYAAQMRLLRAGDPHPERVGSFGFYPLLVAKLALLTSPEHPPAPRSVDEHVQAAGADTARVRTIIALLSALGVPATYGLARLILLRRGALVASALYAASPLAILFSQQARPHAASVAPMVAAVLACVLVRRIPRPATYVLAGVAIGAALSVLHTGASLLPALAAAHWLRDRSRSRGAALGFVAAIVLVASIVLLAYPSGRNGILGGGEGGSSLMMMSGHVVSLDQFHGLGFGRLARALGHYEPWLAALAVSGAVIALIRRARARETLNPGRRADLLVVASWCVPYSLVIGLYDDSYERFLIPLLPCAACAAAYAGTWLSARAGGTALHTAGISMLILVPQACLGAAVARVCGATDTLTRCAAWLRAQVPPGSARVAVLYTLDLPLLRTEPALRENPRWLLDDTRPWLVYQGRLPGDVLADERHELVTVPHSTLEAVESFRADPASAIAGWRAEYVVIEACAPGSPPETCDVRERLQQEHVLVARFGSRRDQDDDRPFKFQHDTSSGWWPIQVFRARRLGPVVEVYRLR